MDDFTPVRITSTTSDVTVKQYDWMADSIEPKTKVTYPEEGALVNHEDGKLVLSNESSEGLTAEIPMKSPLSVKCSGYAGVSVSGHEADLDVRAEHGSCFLDRVKSSSTTVISKGDVNLNSIVSNVSVLTAGSVRAKKIQGETVTISTVNGDIHIQSLYAPNSRIFGKYGGVKVDNLHGNCNIVSGSGDVTIGSSKDNLEIKARGGAVTVTLQDIERRVLIESFGGPVKLYMSDEVCGKAMLSIQSSGKAEVTDEVQMKVNANDKATALVKVMAYGGPVFVARSAGWGENIWSKLEP